MEKMQDKIQRKKWRVYRYLKYRYRKIISNAPERIQEIKKNENRTIWWCWLQGEEHAPDVVKMCLNSVRKHCSGYEIRILTEENYKNYVSFPDYIERKYNKGKISKTHFSDLLRAELLVKYGGVWIDSTVFLTGWEEQTIRENPLVFFRGKNSDTATIGSSWFISAAQDNPILQLTKELLYSYWRNHGFLIEYHLFHLCFRIACEVYEEDWKACPEWYNKKPHKLQKKWDLPYSQELYEKLLGLSWIHKLTYKTTTEDPDSIQQHLIRQFEE